MRAAIVAGLALLMLKAPCLSMSGEPHLSASEFASLVEVAKGFGHGPIPAADGARLVALQLTYKLLGEDRLTAAGRARLAQGI